MAAVTIGQVHNNDYESTITEIRHERVKGWFGGEKAKCFIHTQDNVFTGKAKDESTAMEIARQRWEYHFEHKNDRDDSNSSSSSSDSASSDSEISSSDRSSSGDSSSGD